jgi:alkylhydroperoxidase/carboxymuconolactone decarboxylase family protein YurZ
VVLPVQFDPLQAKDPEFYNLLSELKDMAFGQGILDPKTKFLIGLAINVCLERNDKVKCALGQAKAAGATDQEVNEALRLTYFIKGLSTVQTITETVK